MNLKLASLGLLMFLMSAATGAGQTTQGQNPGSGVQDQSSGKSAQKSITVETKKGTVTIDLPATTYREVGQAQISYFAESDATEVRDELDAYKGDGQFANMYFVYTVKGNRVVRPEEVSVGMVFYTDKARAEDLHGFTLEADGKLFKLDGLTVGDVSYGVSDKKYYRDMNGTIPFALFEQLTNYTLLKVHVGGLVFDVDKSNRDALRDMLRAIESPAK